MKENILHITVSDKAPATDVFLAFKRVLLAMLIKCKAPNISQSITPKTIATLTWVPLLARRLGDAFKGYLSLSKLLIPG